MAVSEAGLSSWKTPFSTPIRKDENVCTDLFQNSEKLLASAVSICRLKGSVECQTGGLITVCEELQSLIRLAFSEIRRLEKDFSAQKSHLEDEVNCLKERVKCLGEIRGAKNGIEKQDCNPVAGDGKNASHESEEVVESAMWKDTNYSPSAEDENLEESDPNIFEVGNTDVTEVPFEDCLSHKDKISSSPQGNTKLNSKKRLKKLSSKKSFSLSNTVNGIDDRSSQQMLLSITEIAGEKQASKRSKTTIAKTTGNFESLEQHITKHQKRGSSNAYAVEEEKSSSTWISKSEEKGSSSHKEVEENSKEVPVDTQAPQVEVTKESETEGKEGYKSNKDRTKAKKTISQGEIQAESGNKQEFKGSWKAKKKRSANAAEQESNEVFRGESTGDKANMNTEPKEDSPLHKKPREKIRKKLSCDKKSKSVSEDSIVEASGEVEVSESECNLETHVSVCATTGQNNNSLNKETSDVEGKDEQLGDMSFLINVNSQLSVFVADGSREECELQPMTARERNDVYKMAQLYKLRARFGTMSGNNLTTVRLSKQADTKMPRPGKVDCLLSELSIASLKQGVKDSPKNQVKRKYAATVGGNEHSVTADDDHNQDGPPKKKISKLSRARKVKS